MKAWLTTATYSNNFGTNKKEITVNALIIDDSKAMRRIIGSIVKGVGFETDDACDGLEGLNSLEAAPTKYDLVLVDWNMPNMNGYEFIKAVRAKDEFNDLRMVMVTTETEPARMAQALMAGVDEFVMKPFTKDVLLEKLRLIGVPIPETV